MTNVLRQGEEEWLTKWLSLTDEEIVGGKL